MSELENPTINSVLKPSKPRAPLKDLDLVFSNDEENTGFLMARKRRVSFANVNKIKEFNTGAESLLVCHTPAYEEPFSSSSDSSYPSSAMDSSNVKLSYNSNLNVTSTYLLKRDEIINYNTMMYEKEEYSTHDNVSVQTNVNIQQLSKNKRKSSLNALDLTKPLRNKGQHMQFSENHDFNTTKRRKSGNCLQNESELKEVVESKTPSISLFSNSTRLSTNNMELTEVITDRMISSSNYVQNSTGLSTNNMDLTEAIENQVFNVSHCIPNSTRLSANNMELTEAIGNEVFNSSHCVPNSTRLSTNNMELTEAIGNQLLSSSHCIPNATRLSTNNMELTEAIGNEVFNSSHCVPNSTRLSTNNMELTEAIGNQVPSSSHCVPNSTRLSTNNMELTEAIDNDILSSSHYVDTRLTANNMKLTEVIGDHFVPNSTRFSSNNMELTEAIGNHRSQIFGSSQCIPNSTRFTSYNMELTEAVENHKSQILSSSQYIPDSTSFSSNMELTEAIGNNKSQIPSSPQTILNSTELSYNNMELTETIGKSIPNSPNATRFSMNNIELTKRMENRNSSSPRVVLNSTELSINNMNLTEDIGKTFQISTHVVSNSTQFCTNNMELTKRVQNQLSASLSTNPLKNEQSSIHHNSLNLTTCSIDNVDFTEPIKNPCFNTSSEFNMTGISTDLTGLYKNKMSEIGESDFKRNEDISVSNENNTIEVNDKVKLREVIDNNLSNSQTSLNNMELISYVNNFETNKTLMKRDSTQNSMNDMSLTKVPKYVQNGEVSFSSHIQTENESGVNNIVSINNVEFTKGLLSNTLYEKDGKTILDDPNILMTKATTKQCNLIKVDAMNCETDFNNKPCGEMSMIQALTKVIYNYKKNDLNVTEVSNINMPYEIDCNDTSATINPVIVVPNTEKTPLNKDEKMCTTNVIDEDFDCKFYVSISTAKNDRGNNDILNLSGNIVSINSNNLNHTNTTQSFQGDLNSDSVNNMSKNKLFTAVGTELHMKINLDEIDNISCKANSDIHETSSNTNVGMNINKSVLINNSSSDTQECHLSVDNINLEKGNNDNEAVSRKKDGLVSYNAKSPNSEICNGSESKNKKEDTISALNESTDCVNVNTSLNEDQQNEILFNNITLRTKNFNKLNKNNDTLKNTELPSQQYILDGNGTYKNVKHSIESFKIEMVTKNDTSKIEEPLINSDKNSSEILTAKNAANCNNLSLKETCIVENSANDLVIVDETSIRNSITSHEEYRDLNLFGTVLNISITNTSSKVSEQNLINENEFTCDLKGDKHIADSDISDKIVNDTKIVDKLNYSENQIKENEFQFISDKSNQIDDYEHSGIVSKDVRVNKSLTLMNKIGKLPAEETTQRSYKSNMQHNSNHFQEFGVSTNEKLEVYPLNTNLVTSCKNGSDFENVSIEKGVDSNYSMQSLFLMESTIFEEEIMSPESSTVNLKSIASRKSFRRSVKKSCPGVVQKRKLLQVDQEENVDESMKGKLIYSDSVCETNEISPKMLCIRDNIEENIVNFKEISLGTSVLNEESMDEPYEDDNIVENHSRQCDSLNQDTAEVMDIEILTNKNEGNPTNKDNSLSLQEDISLCSSNVETLAGRKSHTFLITPVVNSSINCKKAEFRKNNDKTGNQPIFNLENKINNEELILLNNNDRQKQLFNKCGNIKLNADDCSSLKVITDTHKKYELRFNCARKILSSKLHNFNTVMRNKWSLKVDSHGVWSIELLPNLLYMLMHVDDSIECFTNLILQEEKNGCETSWNRYAVNSIKQALPIRRLESSCYSTSRIIDLMNEIEPYVLQTKQFAKELRCLCDFYCAEIMNNILSLDLLTMSSHCWIKVNIDISSRDIKAHDISVSSIIGEVKQSKIRNLFKAVKPGDYRILHFVQEIETNLVILNTIRSE